MFITVISTQCIVFGSYPDNWFVEFVYQCDCDCAGIHTICFHCQQYVEKMLKGFLTLHGVEAPWTHNLRRLIQLAAPHLPELAELADASDQLTPHAAETRYPGLPPPVTRSQAQALIELADRFGKKLLPLLGG